VTETFGLNQSLRLGEAEKKVDDDKGKQPDEEEDIADSLAGRKYTSRCVINTPTDAE
jgi:hypothetical protein